MDHDKLIDIIDASQHCQRNWDLSNEIPVADIQMLIAALTQCPSKQNIAHYNIHAITNRDIIEKLHDHTVGFRVTQTNPQVLANLLLVIEYKPVMEHKNAFKFSTISAEEQMISFKRDALMSVGIAVGYLHMTASIMGYRTGCCACFDSRAAEEILNLKNEVLLMVGVGFNNPELDRKLHHNDHSYVFPATKKEEISVQYYK